MQATPSQPFCDGKKRYTKKEAYRARKVVGRTRGKDLRIYECPKCNGWHLTKNASKHLSDYE